jgi:Doubled CXXCH motif (Paired_CXXCH_1)
LISRSAPKESRRAFNDREEGAVRINKRQWIASALACATALLVSGGAYGQASGISVTKHNLGSSAPANQNSVSDTAEICVFCHTPHGADTTASAPLWNKKLPSGTGYQVYATANSTTIDGQVMTTVGSVSITCLSCHDGTQAMDNIINAPGSGGFVADGGGAGGRAYSWGASPRIDAGGLGVMSSVANLGTDLRDDHPIGIEYCGGGLTGTSANATPGIATGSCKDSDFKQPFSGTINSQPVWWVETGTSDSARTRTDMILYNRSFTLGGTGPAVECASCHDPHVSQGQAGPNSQVAGATFLRVSNNGSAVCLACHTK